jgi:hypothetical protein
MADHLLGDRRCAEWPLAALVADDVGHRGAEHGDRVDAVMAVEIAILGGEDGIDHLPRHPIDRHDDAVLAGELGHETAISGVDLGAAGRNEAGELLRVGQVAAEIAQCDADEGAAADHADDDEDEDDARQPAQDADHRRNTAADGRCRRLSRRVAAPRTGGGSAMLSLPADPGGTGTI